MKRWQKMLMLAATPTISVLHSRWIASLLGVQWDANTRETAFVVMFIVTIVAGIIVAGTELP